MKKVFFTLLLLIAIPVVASHIVGGEFELIHLTENRYRLNLILYFDAINGSPGAKDQSVTASIFRKSDNAFMMNVVLTLTQESDVSYTQPECSHGEIVTNRLFYTREIVLPSEQYGDASGYYVVWQRCCRNYQIANIYSNVPSGANDPFAAGQTFYLEFPPVTKDGSPFYNSSPRLFPPLNDYACPGRPYYVDFAGKDDDGDSLYYSLVTPLNTTTSEALPQQTPLPYREVRWRPGFSLEHVMRGSPDLNISKDGFLRVTPSLQGLFVFAVKVEEFRNKIKIGETRRDFQMLVVDGCSPALPPKIVGKKLTDEDFTYDNFMSVSYANTVPDEERCIQVRVSDPDSEKADQFFTEHIKLKVIPLNFKSDQLNEVLPDDFTGVLVHGSTKEFRICFPACPYFSGGPYEIGVIAMDDACSLPLMDTLRVKVSMETPANSNPYFTTALNTGAVLQEGDSMKWSFQIRDDDLDDLLVSPVTDGFLLATAGMKFQITDQQKGLVNGYLKWDAYCNIYDFTNRTDFQVRIRADDVDKCDANSPIFATYNLGVILPGNASPEIYTDLTTSRDQKKVWGLTRTVGETLSFNVFGKDTVDHDFLMLTGAGKGFKLSDFAMSFSSVNGNNAVQSKFQWEISCDDLKRYRTSGKDSIDLQFLVVDNSNKCRIYKADTVDVSLRLAPRRNSAPVILVNSINPNISLSNNQVNATLGQQIALGLQGVDADTTPKDKLQLTLIDVDGNVPLEGYNFTSAQGTSPVATTWTWNPDCNIFQDEVYENNYTLTFRIADDRCVTATADTVKVKINIKDVDGTDEKFSPPNFFSPNDDGVNDYYAMEVKDAETGALVNVLPLDNCTARFQGVRIYNRWGKQVYESTDRDFKWYGKGEAAGVYYYIITYTHKEYKGALSIRY